MYLLPGVLHGVEWSYLELLSGILKASNRAASNQLTSF